MNSKDAKKRIDASVKSGRALTPYSVYFYYIKLGSKDPKDRQIRAYYFDNGKEITNIEAIVREKLGPNAVADKDYPPKIGFKFDAVKWRRISYFVILADGPLSVNHDNVLVFQEGDGNQDNHSFHDFYSTDIEIYDDVSAKKRDMTLFYCINSMTDKDGEYLLDGHKEKFRFDVTYKGGVTKPRTRGPGDGGTNMGPPVPPPSRHHKAR